MHNSNYSKKTRKNKNDYADLNYGIEIKLKCRFNSVLMEKSFGENGIKI